MKTPTKTPTKAKRPPRGLSRGARLARRGKRDPVWWTRRVLGDKPWKKQREILQSFKKNRVTCVGSCNGAGKSYIAARAALWFLYNHRPSLVITTAPTLRQVKNILWKEIAVAHRRAKVPLGGTLLTQRLELEKDWFAIGFTANDADPDRFRGFHERNIAVIADESSGVSDDIFVGIDSVLTVRNARLLMIGNPTNPFGRFGTRLSTGGEGVITISAFETPNFTEFDITMADIRNGAWEEKVAGREYPYPNLTTPEWVADWFTDPARGESHPMWIPLVLGQQVSDTPESIVPPAWFQAARRRYDEAWEEWDGVAAKYEWTHGVDVGDGQDPHARASRRGPVLYELERKQTIGDRKDTMRCVEMMTTALMTKYGQSNVDRVGVGAGVLARLLEIGEVPVEVQGDDGAIEYVLKAVKAVGVAFGDKANYEELYKNLRAEAFWLLRRAFELGTIAIAPLPAHLETMIMQELAAIEYMVDDRRVTILKKDKIREKLGRSPDLADALAMCWLYHNLLEKPWYPGMDDD